MFTNSVIIACCQAKKSSAALKYCACLANNADCHPRPETFQPACLAENCSHFLVFDNKNSINFICGE